MPFTIGPLATHNDYRAAETIQAVVWGKNERDVVPGHVLITAQRHGGVLLGAWHTAPDPPQLVGFVFSFLGRGHAREWQQCSHLLAVLPAYRDQQLGYRLKLAQRAAVLAQGVDLITWTYDPLESRNAYLNMHKLGAVCSTYLPNLYGAMDDALNQGLHSDRFEAAWHIRSDHVVARLDQPVRRSVAVLQAEGVLLINSPRRGAFPQPPTATLPLADERLLVAIPANYQAIKAADMPLARAWRDHTHDLFTAAFAAGYVAVDLLPGEATSCYVLEQRAAHGDQRIRAD